MVDKTAGTHEESEEAAVAVYFLDTVEKAADHVMAAGCLTAGKDHADIDRLACSGGGVLFETDFRKTVGVGEQFADSFLVSYRFCRTALYNLYGSCEHDGELGLIGCTSLLQSTLFHCKTVSFKWLIVVFENLPQRS